MTPSTKQHLLGKIKQRSGIENLDERERKVLLGGVLFVVGFVILQFVLMPFWDARINLEKSIKRKKDELATILLLQQEYQSLKAQEGGIKSRVEQRLPTFTLFTFLDSQATKSEVKKQIKYMKPSTLESDDIINESMVEMKLQRITLKALVEFIRLVESEENVVSIRRISIQESGKEPGYLDAILQIVTFELKG